MMFEREQPSGCFPNDSYVGGSDISFCSHTDNEVMCCKCAEEEEEFEWVWSADKEKGQAGNVVLEPDKRQVSFSPVYSSGTAAIRGQCLLSSSYHHYWELKMTSAVYGTDVMVGVSTAKYDLNQGVNLFCSLLGRDKESWGFSYTGDIQHKSESFPYGPRWGKGSIVGVHYDPLRGTLEFFVNRKPLGIAFMGLQNKELYPVVTSTSARSGMKLVCSHSFPESLQFHCAQVVYTQLCKALGVQPKDLNLPPGLQTFIENNYGAFFRTLPGHCASPKDGDMNKRKRSCRTGSDRPGKRPCSFFDNVLPSSSGLSRFFEDFPAVIHPFLGRSFSLSSHPVCRLSHRIGRRLLDSVQQANEVGSRTSVPSESERQSGEEQRRKSRFVVEPKDLDM